MILQQEDKVDNQVLQILDTRRSHRAYQQKPLSREQLDALTMAGISSPSANNLQPWHFSVVQDQELLNRINREACKQVSLLPESSRNPRFSDPDFHIFYHAPAVIFISTTPEPRKLLDCGIAVQSIAMAAESLGLGSVILGLPLFAFAGGMKKEFEKALRFPAGHSFAIAIAVGYATDTKQPPARDRSKISYI